ncbi:XrtA system polysaccharide deacetylase [Motiliproteus sp. SC1-56]|uniref:XrtA system polysaccharide deacetylase n=1 Tax=Motiliproteus sp. SC1-56 TaxID=2799565 RepID=UPI001A8BF7AD|nr:XrtA system polysaccharide deacetylase [Motiliproteus sp. SC1-56]
MPQYQPQTDTPPKITNALSVDVEDYFQVAAFENQCALSTWESMECRVERNMERILALFDEYNIKATFFTLGWVAERHPRIVQRIVTEGHELASHGYQHRRATTQSRTEFREDVYRAKELLEAIGAQPVNGYRAPSYSIGAGNLWALDTLQEIGHEYSSSIYPVRHDLYGMPDAPRYPFRSHCGLLEIPISTVRLGRRNLPFGGGGFFRLYPYALSRWGIKRINDAEGQAAVFYFHPWEIDAEQPRIEGASRRSRFRHYLNLDKTEARLKRLLADFKWGRMDEVFSNALQNTYRPTFASPPHELAKNSV